MILKVRISLSQQLNAQTNLLNHAWPAAPYFGVTLTVAIPAPPVIMGLR